VPPVSTVIVAFQSGEFLRRCLTAVASGSGEVVVVDNGSPDGEAALVREEFPIVRLIERSSNAGFATAANAGIEATHARWVLLVNPDAWPVEDGFERLAEFAEGRPGLGVAGPLLYDEHGHPQRSTIRPPLSPAALALWATLPDAVTRLYGLWRRASRGPRSERVRASEFLQGSVMLIRRDAFDRIGGFDESFFMYGEDADLCARLRSAGWTVELCPAARFVHVGGGSSREQGERMHIELLRSWLRLIGKLESVTEAERARRWLRRAMWIRALATRRERDRAVASWLASGRVADLLGLPG
jgi:N-acetylglucosaminyl-diphospho-decaprenol L-rhamnosyltransferase